MTREEAIKRLEWLEMVAEHVDSVTIGSKCTEDWEAYNMAIAALREQEERSKGCEFCRGEKSLHSRDDSLSFKGDFYPGVEVCISGGQINIEAVANVYEPNYMDADIDICYCPMCGRRLEEV